MGEKNIANLAKEIVESIQTNDSKKTALITEKLEDADQNDLCHLHRSLLYHYAEEINLICDMYEIEPYQYVN